MLLAPLVALFASLTARRAQRKVMLSPPKGKAMDVQQMLEANWELANLKKVHIGIPPCCEFLQSSLLLSFIF